MVDFTRKQLFLDIETLCGGREGNFHDSVVISVAGKYFAFDGETNDTLDDTSFELFPNILEQLIEGRRVERGTMDWWNSEPNKRGLSYHYGAHSTCAQRVRTVLSTIKTSIKYMRPQYVWVWGSEFDVAILNDLSNQFVGDVVVPHFKARCARSVCSTITNAKELRSGGCSHIPLEDVDRDITVLRRVVNNLSINE